MLTGIVAVAAGGAVGSVARYLVTLAAARWLGAGFPWGTLAVNVAGSFAMGVVIAWIAARMHGSADLRLLLATGFLGGFTTFSAFSLDFATLVERRETLQAFGYAGASVALSLAAVFAGLSLARALWS